MLNKNELQKQIEDALYNSFKNAMTAVFNSTTETVDGNGKTIKTYTPDQISEIFANEAKRCSIDIADAIDIYIKSIQITINIENNPMVVAAGLTSPSGPVAGTIILGAPAVLNTTIN